MTSLTPIGTISSPDALGEAIRQRRKALGLTQTDAALSCGVGLRFLSELERGKPSVRLDKVLRILQGLGLELTLMARTGSGPEPDPSEPS